MKTIKFFAMLLFMVSAAMSMPTCGDKDKEDDENENGNSAEQPTSITISGFSEIEKPSKVKLTIEGTTKCGTLTVEEVNYAVSFTFQLKGVDTSCLKKVNEVFPSSLVFSNTNTKVGKARIGYSGFFEFGYYSTAKSVEAYLYYASENVSVSGANSATYNVNLKKGWNWVYGVEERGKETMTTTKPSETLKWYMR